MGDTKHYCEGALCEECGSPVSWRMSPDHLKKKSQGGGDDPDNLLVKCGKCHSGKHNIKEV